MPRCLSGASRWSAAAPACSAPAQPSTALAIKAALHVLVPPLGDKQMLLSSEVGNSSFLAFQHVLGQASLLRSQTPPGLHSGSGRADLEMLQPCILLVCALVCTGMAVLRCHLPSQLSLKMTQEQIPTSATSVRVSGKLLLCLSPLPPCLAGWALGAVLQAPPLAHKCRQLISSRAEFFIQGWRQRLQVRPSFS